jgi:hypothetical protein
MPGSGRVPASLLAALAASAVGLVGACARQGAPPGGPVDRRPPVVVSTVPDTFAVDTTFRGPVRFKFDERISEQVTSGTLDGAVVVSPQTGDVKVSHSRSGIEVKMDGGFKRGLVYRVTLLPVIRDLFNNRMYDPFELIFSTGAPFVNSAVAGMVWDRITGQPMEDMEVTAVPRSDTALTYVARSDSSGIYVFRYLPAGSYRLTAFDDRNRNGKLDSTETRGLASLTLTGPDTVLPVDVAALRPDTAPARVKGALALDSVTVLVSMDHYVDPEEPDSDITASLSNDSGPAPRVARLYKEYGYNRWVVQFRDSVTRADSIAAAAAKAAAEKSAAADTSARDTTGAKPGPAAARPDTTTPVAKRHLPPLLPAGTSGSGPTSPSFGRGTTGRESGLGPDGKPLPKQRIVLILDSALVPGVAYKVRVQGVTTVNGVPMDGGDTTRVMLRPPKDTTSAVKDTSKVRGDTATARDGTGPPDRARSPRREGRGTPRVGAPGALPAKRGGGR